MIACLSMLTLPELAAAQDSSIGGAEYMTSCAQCHGAGGKGDGVLAGFLTSTTPDLTRLQADNGGVFPVARIYSIIDGTGASGSHGSAEMPAWGLRYSVSAPQQLGWDFLPSDRDAFVRGRILALVEYISTLQEE